MSNFSYTTQDIGNGSGVLVQLVGSIDPSTFEDFQAMFDELLKGDTANILIDFGELKYINSTGMGLMVQTVDGFGSKGGQVLLMNIPPKVMLVMEMLGLQEFFQVVSGPEEALKVFGGGTAAPSTVEMRLKEDAGAAPEAAAGESGGTAASGMTECVCGHCGASLTLAGPGRYRCPRCRSFLEADAQGNVNTFAEEDEAAVELVLPAREEFVESLRLLLVTVAGTAGVNGDAVGGITEAVEACGRYLISEALAGKASERLHVLVTGGDSVTVRLAAAGKPLPLSSETIAEEESLAGAAGAVSRMEFSSAPDGNQFIIEQKAG
jgi:anti-anti-sigma factor